MTKTITNPRLSHDLAGILIPDDIHRLVKALVAFESGCVQHRNGVRCEWAWGEAGSVTFTVTTP